MAPGISVAQHMVAVISIVILLLVTIVEGGGKTEDHMEKTSRERRVLGRAAVPTTLISVKHIRNRFRKDSGCLGSSRRLVCPLLSTLMFPFALWSSRYFASMMFPWMADF